MAKIISIHVVPRNDGWAVRKEGNARATSIYNTQREAVEAARNLARSQSTELIIHRSDGRIRERDSYSNDPLPPKEPRKVLSPEGSSSVRKKAIEKAVRDVVQESRASSVKASKKPD